jgi:RimJ/RimL family protein N-acetyltransferase
MLRATKLETPRLVLSPLRADDADAMFAVLDDVRLHTFIGGEPLALDALRKRCARLEAGVSPDGREGWLNWVVREREGGAVVGSTQATVRGEHADIADIAWIVGTPWQRRGYAVEASLAMRDWLVRSGVRTLVANVHPKHRASERVAEALSLRITDDLSHGECVWRWDSP